MKKHNLESLFKSQNGYLTKDQLPSRSLYYRLLELIHEGQVERVKNGVYFMESATKNPEMIDVSKLVPGGVICMDSAWFHYELTVQIPQAFHIAIEKSRKLKLPDYPPIDLYYWKKEYHELGVVKQEMGGFEVDIYSMEKSVCDAVKFRNKIGFELMSGILKRYLKRKDRNLEKLMEYAKAMRLDNVLRTYLEVNL
jgi:predicted transcriptional regulator of viral defense system